MALNNAVYLWSAATGETELLMQCSGSDDYVTSVKWASDGNHVAVGTSDADVQLWDANRVKQVVCSTDSAHTCGAGLVGIP